MPRGVLIGAISALVAIAGTLWLTDLPLGVPGEWEWKRIPASAPVSLVLGFVLLIFPALALLGTAIFCDRRWDEWARGKRATGLCCLLLSGYWCVSSLQDLPVKAGREKAAYVVMTPAASGYFHRAREVKDVPGFLAGYEDLMAEGDVLHTGTHPPGLFLAYRFLIDACESLPSLTRLLLATTPENVNAMINQLEQIESITPGTLSDAERASVWLAAVLTQLVVLATVFPLYGWIAKLVSPSAAWRAVCFWPLIPAVAVFLPKSDALMPFIGMLFLWAWSEAIDTQASRTRRLIFSIAAGLIGFAGMFTTLAMLPVFAVAFLQTAIPVVRDWKVLRPTVIAVGTAAAALLGAALFWLMWDLNLFSVWLWNYRNHAGFYDQFPRSYLAWLLVNPIELAVALGGIVVVVVAISARNWKKDNVALWLPPVAVWMLLWLSGKNMGEAARLWLFLMPWWVALAAPAFAKMNRWWVILLLQLGCCAAIVSRVTGFDMLVQ